MPIIKGNYYTQSHFRFELDHVQVSKLIALFLTQVVAPSAKMPRTTLTFQIVDQPPSEPRTIEEGGNILSDAYVGLTPCNKSDGNSVLTGPSCVDDIRQPNGVDIEAMGKSEMELIYEKLQKLAVNGEASDSDPVYEVQEFGNANKMHDDSQEGSVPQEENMKESSLLPSDLQSIIAEVVILDSVISTYKQYL